MTALDVGADARTSIWRWMPVRLLFLFIALLLVDAACQAGPAILQPHVAGTTRDQATLFSALLTAILMIFAYRLLVRWTEKRKPTELARKGAVSLAIFGAAIGFSLFAAVYAYLGFAGVAQFKGFGSTDGLAIALAISVSSAIGEEIIFRGVVFRLFEERFGTLIGLVVSAGLFGLLHAANKGATPASTLAIALEAGILLGVAYSVSRSLWLPIGLHFGWNFTEGGVFGAAVSGGKMHGLVNVPLNGPVALTGGTFGPEASLPAVVVCVGAAALLLIFVIARGEWKGFSLLGRR